MSLFKKHNRRFACLLVLGLIVGLTAPASAHPGKPDRGATRFDGHQIRYLVDRYPEAPESLALYEFHFRAYDGKWRLANGESFTGDGIWFQGYWSVCDDDYENPDIPEAGALMRLYRWETVTTLDDGESEVTFTDGGLAGILDVRVQISGTYLEIPATDVYECDQVADPILSEPLGPRELILTLDWSSVVTGKGRNKQATTTVTVASGSFGGTDLWGLPTGEDPDYLAESGSWKGFVG